MLEAVQLQKTPEGKFQFGSQQEYDKALESMIANPTSMEDLSSLMNSDNVVLGTPQPGGQPPAASPSAPAPGQPPAAATPTPEHQAPAPASTPPGTTNSLVERLRQKAREQGVEIMYQSEDHIIDGIIQKEKRIKFLNDQRNGMISKSELERVIQEKKELEDRLKTIQESPPAPQPQQSQQSNVGESKKAEIDAIRKKLREVTDPFSDEATSMQRDLNDLLVYELDRVVAKGDNPVRQDNSEVLQMIRDVRQELKDLKTDTNAARAEAENARKFKEDLKAIDELQKSHPEFKSDRGMNEMDASYRRWASELFYLRHKRMPQNVSEMNIVAHDYMGDDVDLKIMAQKAGLEEPSDVKQYLNICNLLVLRDKLTETMGSDHTLEQVLVYKMARDGSINDAMMQQRQLGADAIKNSQQNRDTNYARQLDHASGASSEQIGDTMTIDQAMEIMSKITPERAARNAADKELLDKAFNVWKDKAQGKGSPAQGVGVA